MCVTGDECCDGSRRSSEANEFQYCCSEVIVEGPLGSFTGCSSCTSAAMAGDCTCECAAGACAALHRSRPRTATFLVEPALAEAGLARFSYSSLRPPTPLVHYGCRTRPVASHTQRFRWQVQIEHIELHSLSVRL